MESFKEASRVIQKLQQHGYEAYFVGGSVRDYLMHRSSGDIDIATSALPTEVMEVFPHHVPVGLEHGTVLVLFEGHSYEITTFRTERGYEDFRRPSEVVFVRSLREDLQRRDFTMNAIAMTKEGTLIDPFEGMRAITEKVIETVGAPHERFQEDALRIMRGIRFVSVLDFTLHPQTKAAIVQYAPLLVHISVERITVEFEKLLLGVSVTKALQLIVESNLHHYLPHMEKQGQQLLQAATYDWSRLQSKTEAWAFLLYSIGLQQVGPVLRRWKLSNKSIAAIGRVHALIRQRQQEEWHAWSLYQAGLTYACMAERICGVLQRVDVDTSSLMEQYEALPIKERQQLQITGTELIQWANRSGGPWVADVLTQIERAVVEGIIENTQIAIKEWCDTCKLLLENSC